MWNDGEKNWSRTFFAKLYWSRTSFLFDATFHSISLRKVLLLHNLSQINIHDKFTLEDTVIIAMTGSKVTSFPKTHDAGYRSLARVVWACLCYKFLVFQRPISSTFLHIILHWNGFSSHNLAIPSSITYLFLCLSLACVRTCIWGIKRFLTKWGEKNVRDQSIWPKLCGTSFFLWNDDTLKK